MLPCGALPAAEILYLIRRHSNFVVPLVVVSKK